MTNPLLSMNLLVLGLGDEYMIGLLGQPKCLS